MSSTNPSADASFQCESCRKNYRWKPELAGKKVRCGCGNVMRVPATIASAPAVAAAPVKRSKPAAAPVAKPEPRADDGFNMDDLASLETNGKMLADEPVMREPAWVSKSTAYTPPPGAAIGTPMQRPKKSAGSMFAGIAGIFASGGTQVLWAFGLIIGGIAVAIFCYVMQVRHDAFMKIAKETTGEIVSSVSISKSGKASRRANPDNWTFSFDVSYQVDGKSYVNDAELHGDRLPRGWNPDDSDDWRGRKLPLFYDPKDPNTIEASDDAKGKDWMWGYIVAAVLAGMGGWRLIRGGSSDE